MPPSIDFKNAFISISLNTISTTKGDGEEHPYDEDDLYFEPNNAGHHSIIWISCIYDCYGFYLKFKAINNFFFKTMFRSMRKVYIEEETRY